MLDGVAELTLELLNKATQAWVEIEYNRAVHRETGCSPVERFAAGARCAPRKPLQRIAARRLSPGNQEESASKRRHDLAGGSAVRDSGKVPSLPRSHRSLRPLGPRPRSISSTGTVGLFWLRFILSTKPPTPTAAVPRSSPVAPTCRRTTGGDALPASCRPLLKRILQEYSATGMPPAYLPKTSPARQRRTIMNSKKLLALYGLKWNPFSPELPSEALLATPRIENFAWRVEQLVQEGGFALITGESGTGKSVALRIVAGRLSALRDVTVGVIERPQSKSPDFYRELGDIFAVKLAPHNRWCGFKALRERWKAHVASSRIRPVLLIDEAQEMSPDVLSELRILSSADFDATSLLTVVLSGDGRLLELLRHEDLVPLGTRIRTRLVTEPATREELLELLQHALAEGRQCIAHDGRAHGDTGRPQRGQLPPAHDHGGRALGLWHGARSRAARREVLPRGLSAEEHTPRDQEESEGVTMAISSEQMLPVVRVAELPSDEIAERWLVEQLWCANSVGVIGGAPKCAKTWLGLDMALSVATGTPCLGKYTRAGAGTGLGLPGRGCIAGGARADRGNGPASRSRSRSRWRST